MQKHNNQYYLEGLKHRKDSVVKEIYREFLPSVISFVLKNNGQKEDARDVFNKVIYQFTERLDREDIEVKSKFEAFLFTACKNIWRRELLKIKKRQVTNEHVKELYYEEKDMALATMEQERWELFNSKLTELSENCSNVLQLFFNKKSSKEIMTELNYSSEITVRQRIFKCKSKLIELIKKDKKYLSLKTK